MLQLWKSLDVGLPPWSYTVSVGSVGARLKNCVVSVVVIGTMRSLFEFGTPTGRNVKDGKYESV